MKLQLSQISPMDFTLFASEISLEDFQFYRKHTAAFKQMWEDQVTDWFVNSVKFHYTSLLGSFESRSTFPTCSFHGALRESGTRSECVTLFIRFTNFESICCQKLCENIVGNVV